MNRPIGLLGLILTIALGTASARADDIIAPEIWSLHSQMTFAEQYHPAFNSPYLGPNSLSPASSGRETFDATFFLGARVWGGGELYADPEIDQGFGLSNTLGVAGFPSGEAYKVGKGAPYFRLQRLFLRQTIDLGGSFTSVTSGQNQLGHTGTSDNLIITAGKIAVSDIFDTNVYAHDPKSDFLNWAIIESGAFDYAADAWGYSYGIAAEWSQSWWTVRTGLFDLSRVPNTTQLIRGLGQYELVTEGEARYSAWELPGRIRLLGYYNRARMGSYNDAVALALRNNTAADTSQVRRPASRPGIAINAEQQLTDQLGVFVRSSWNDGSEESYEFTEINRSVALGVSLKGTGWNRSEDTLGLAGVINDISGSARRYLATGGMGIIIGDGVLPRYSTEDILETYYKASMTEWFAVSFDYQFIANPAYSGERGPVSIIGARLHTQI